MFCWKILIYCIQIFLRNVKELQTNSNVFSIFNLPYSRTIFPLIEDIYFNLFILIKSASMFTNFILTLPGKFSQLICQKGKFRKKFHLTISIYFYTKNPPFRNTIHVSNSVIEIMRPDYSPASLPNEHCLVAHISTKSRESLFTHYTRLAKHGFLFWNDAHFPFSFPRKWKWSVYSEFYPLYAVCSALFSLTLVFRISVHSCAIDRHYRINVPKHVIYIQYNEKNFSFFSFFSFELTISSTSRQTFIHKK